jgi:hypothetical protein
MTAAQLDDAEGHALVEAIHQRKNRNTMKEAELNEAVERGAKALFESMEDQPWEAASPEETLFFRTVARKVIKAALQ